MKPQIVRVVLNANREEDRRILDYFLYHRLLHSTQNSWGLAAN